MTRHFSGAQGRPVRVVLSNGAEIQGIALSDNTFEIPFAFFLQSNEFITIDGERREITHLSHEGGNDSAQSAGGPLDYAYTRVTHRNPQAAR